MSPLDINQSDKGNDRIAVKAFEVPGNKFSKGIYGQSLTDYLQYDGWLMSTFYFPVDCAVWSIGAEFGAVANKDNRKIEVGEYMTAAVQGVHQIGISMFSSRDLPWNGTAGMTPMTQAQKMARDPDGNEMKWASYGADASGPALDFDVEVATRTRGYFNKAARQLLYSGYQVTGTNKSKNIDFTKNVKKGKKTRKRAFDVSAGTKLVFWSRNVSGSGNESREVETSAYIIPRVQFFPKENVIQNYTYRDESHDRWGATMAVTLDTEEGDGVYALWRTQTADEVKN